MINRIRILPTPESLAEFVKVRSIRSLCHVLGVEESVLSGIAYRKEPIDNYKLFFVAKKRGGVRVIQAPEETLKKIQANLNYLLNHLYATYAPLAAHGFVLKRSIVTNASAHVGKKWVLNCDLSDFYGSVRAPRVHGLFRSSPFSFPPKVCDVLTRLCTTRIGLPQGAPTSSTLSNMIAYELDHRLMSLAQKYGYDYTRYADDITLSSNTPFPESVIHFVSEAVENQWILGEKLSNIIEDCGFRVNSDKTRLQSHLERQTVTGLTVNKKVNVARQYIREVRGMIHAYKKYGKDAIDVFLEKYQKPSYRISKSERNQYKENAFFNVLAGKLVFIKMVRGAQDPVYLKLLSSVQGDLIAHGFIPCDTKLTELISFEGSRIYRLKAKHPYKRWFIYSDNLVQDWKAIFNNKEENNT